MLDSKQTNPIPYFSFNLCIFCENPTNFFFLKNVSEKKKYAETLGNIKDFSEIIYNSVSFISLWNWEIFMQYVTGIFIWIHIRKLNALITLNNMRFLFYFSIACRKMHHYFQINFLFVWNFFLSEVCY